jgi:hypothetical protein
MKKNCFLTCFLLLIACMALLPASISCTARTGTPQSNPVNQILVRSQNFSLDTLSVSLETKVTGTVFITGADEKSAIITALVDIDFADWAGIEFLFPCEWEVTDIITDYPRGNSSPADYTTVWQTADSDVEWTSRVDIGYTNHTALTPGGTGIICIELKPSVPEESLPDSLEMMIAAGSSGTTVAYPCSLSLRVPLD